MPPLSRIGPLALEAPLGKPTASGQVFRAVHIEQRKLLAVRVFSVPLGLTPESRHQFAEQLEQLKQLRHDGIVRCYGGGFDSRNAYLVYELIDGESLETILQRRGRLPWETAIEAAQRLAEALQYAHLMGWIHGRIRPEKLLQSKSNAGIKLNDFRRDAIASTIGGGPPKLDELQYCAPEQFDNDVVPDEKCDLYALGAVLYTMLVGHPPITAASVSELSQVVRTQTPPSVQSLVLDCPVWLSAVVDQLLAKDPRQRPFSAAAVQLAFKEAQRRESEGVGVLQHATSGFSALRLNTSRDEAEKVLGIRPKKDRKQNETPIWERPLVLIGALMVCVAVAVWFMLPLSEPALRQRAEKLLASEQWTDWNNARDVYLTELLDRFPDGQNSEWAREQVDYVDMLEAERRLERNARMGRPPTTEAERRFVEARQYEQFGDRATALDMYRGIVNILADNASDKPIINLARRQIHAIEERPFDRDELKRVLVTKLEEADRLYRSGNVLGAKNIWESIVNLYRSNQETKPMVDQAQTRLEGLKGK